MAMWVSRRRKEELVLTGEGRNNMNTKKWHYTLPKMILRSFHGLLQAGNWDDVIQERVIYLLAVLSAFVSFLLSLLGSSSAYLHWKN